MHLFLGAKDAIIAKLTRRHGASPGTVQKYALQLRRGGKRDTAFLTGEYLGYSVWSCSLVQRRTL